MVKVFRLKGNNLSGKSDYMKKIASSNGTLIPPTISESFSGLVNSSFEEIEVQNRRSVSIVEKKKILKYLGISDELLDKAPQILSGGEKARLSIACSIFHDPNSVCLDSTLEQIDIYSRQKIFDFIITQFHQLYFADNCDELVRNTKLLPVEKENNRFHKQIELMECENLEVENVKECKSLELINISFSYDCDSQILNNFSVFLEAGRVYHLSGKNGAGKSTLARVLTGILPLESGKILLNGEEICPFESPGEFVNCHFQDPNAQLFYSTITEEISTKQKHIGTYQIAECFGLQNVLNDSPWDLPISIRKRLTLASSLSFDKSWYILDEPTLFQDSHSIKQIRVVIEKLAKSGRGIILITHNKSILQSLTPTVIEL